MLYYITSEDQFVIYNFVKGEKVCAPLKITGDNFKLSNDETFLVTWKSSKFYIYYLSNNELTEYETKFN